MCLLMSNPAGAKPVLWLIDTGVEATGAPVSSSRALIHCKTR